LAGNFDYCPKSRVVTELAPDETDVMSMNGWQFSSRPRTPYRPSFKVKLSGMRWYLNSAGTALDVTTNPTINAGRLLNFYKLNRKWDTFSFPHEYLGIIICRFKDPVNIPAAIPDSGGLIEAFEVNLIQHNASWTI